MKQTQLLDSLVQAVSAGERRKLMDNTGIVISAFNRRTLLEMLRLRIEDDGEVDPQAVAALRECLEGFLAQHLPEKPEAWKWIILSCIYLRFIAGRPLHPQEAVHYRAVRRRGVIRYLCPERTTEPGSVCLFCVCDSDI